MKKELKFGVPSAALSMYGTLAAVPEVQLLFIGPLACTRHGILDSILTLQERLSFLCVSETDVVTGSYLDKVTQAAEEIYSDTLAKGLILISCCQNAFLGTDFGSIKQKLHEKLQIPIRHLEINRLYLYAKRKKATTNISLAELIYDLLLPAPRAKELTVNLIGYPTGINKESEIYKKLYRAGVKHIYSIADMTTFEEYQRMSQAHLNITLNEAMVPIAESLRSRLNIPFLPLDAFYSLDALYKQYQAIGHFLNATIDIGNEIDELRKRTENVRKKLLDTELLIDGGMTEHPMSLAKWLLESGFHIKGVRMTPFSTKEPKIENWLCEQDYQLTITLDPYKASPMLLSPAQLRKRSLAALPSVGLQACHRALDEIESARLKEEQNI